jgi:hypothetical protein
MIPVNPMLASHARIMGFTWLDWESPGFRGYAHMFTNLISTGENKTRTTADDCGQRSDVFQKRRLNAPVLPGISNLLLSVPKSKQFLLDLM